MSGTSIIAQIFVPLNYVHTTSLNGLLYVVYTLHSDGLLI